VAVRDSADALERDYGPEEQAGEGSVSKGRAAWQQDAGDDHMEHEVCGERVLDAAGQMEQECKCRQVGADLQVGERRAPPVGARARGRSQEHEDSVVRGHGDCKQ